MKVRSKLYRNNATAEYCCKIDIGEDTIYAGKLNSNDERHPLIGLSRGPQIVDLTHNFGILKDKPKLEKFEKLPFEKITFRRESSFPPANSVDLKASKFYSIGFKTELGYLWVTNFSPSKDITLDDVFNVEEFFEFKGCLYKLEYLYLNSLFSTSHRYIRTVLPGSPADHSNTPALREAFKNLFSEIMNKHLSTPIWSPNDPTLVQTSNSLLNIRASYDNHGDFAGDRGVNCMDFLKSDYTSNLTFYVPKEKISLLGHTKLIGEYLEIINSISEDISVTVEERAEEFRFMYDGGNSAINYITIILLRYLWGIPYYKYPRRIIDRFKKHGNAWLAVLEAVGTVPEFKFDWCLSSTLIDRDKLNISFKEYRDELYGFFNGNSKKYKSINSILDKI